MTPSKLLASTPRGRRALALARLIRMAKSQGWDERDKAKPQYLGPDDGHYNGCMGWEDCHCGTYANPHREVGR